MSRYFNLYYHQDERVPRVRRLADSRLVRIAELYSEQELKTSPTYNWALPEAGYQNGLNVRLDGPYGTNIAWTLADSTERDGWATAQTEMIERLLPHVRQYVRVRQAIVHAEALCASLSGLLDSTRVGVILLDRQGRIAQTNDRAYDILRQGDGLFDRDGLLRAWLPDDNANLEALLAGALPASGVEAVSGFITVRRSRGLPRFTLQRQPGGRPSDGLQGVAERRCPVGRRAGRPSACPLGRPNPNRSGSRGDHTGADGGGKPDSGVVVGRQNSE